MTSFINTDTGNGVLPAMIAGSMILGCTLARQLFLPGSFRHSGVVDVEVGSALQTGSWALDHSCQTAAAF